MARRFAASSGLALLFAGCSPIVPPAAIPSRGRGAAVQGAASSGAASPVAGLSPGSPTKPSEGAAPGHAPPDIPDVTIDESVRSRVIAELATHLSAEYVFPEVAERLAREVTERHAAGRYGGVTSALEFARALTAELQASSKDKHLRVMFQPEPPGGMGGASRAPFEPPRNGAIHQLRILEDNIGYLQVDGVPPLA